MRTTPYVIWWAIAVHAAWGIALILDPRVAPVAILIGLHWFISLGVDGAVLGLVLVAAALLAAWGLVLHHRVSQPTAFLMLMPQYLLLLASFAADTGSVISGDVNGQPVDRLLLFTALWPVMIAAILHSAAILERQLMWTRR